MKFGPHCNLRLLSITTAIISCVLPAAPAHAICAPASGDGVTATCTGTTNNQDTYAGIIAGYGQKNQTDLNTTVVEGATVTGTHNGINFYSGSVTNAGAVTGTLFSGIFAKTPAGTGTITVNNSGSITGGNYGINTFTDVTVTNSGTITGIASLGIVSFNGAVTLTNTVTGTISGGISAGTSATVSNSGSIAGRIDADNTIVTNFLRGTISDGIRANTSATVVNSGSIIGGIRAGTSATVSNSGSIAGGIAADNTIVSNALRGTISDGIRANARATVTNSGTIAATAANGIGIRAGTTGTITNSGTISGGSGTAIRFNAGGTPGSDTLTILPGARFGGLVNFGGGADKVNFGAGSWILNTANFDKTLSTVTTPGNPYFVTPNQIVVADVSGFGQQNRAIMDITGWINSVLPDAPVFAPGEGGRANSFAAADTASSPFEAFASVPQDALGYAATKAPVFKAASVTYADGNAIWAKGFGGQRQQDSNGAVIGGTTTGYGGAVGYERVLDPTLKIGALVGGSTNTTNLYQSAGSSSTDTVFGGGYGRKTWGATFLDLAVIGGNLDNRNARNINGGLAVQTATAAYGGWFVDPSLTLGRRIDIDGRGFTVTPAIKVRYVAAHFDGYTETGSTANLTVAGRDFQAWEERAELTLANSTTTANGSRVTARVTGGILGQQRSSGGQVNIALLGQSFLAATPDRASIAGGYGSAGIDWQTGRVTLFAAGEATYSNDVARSYAGKGGVRVGW